MKKLLLIVLLPLSARALNFEVVGPCSPQPILQTTTTLRNTTLGNLTEFLLKKSGLPFEGDKFGIKSINHSPTGDQALEVLSNSTMRSYGWCVEVDGEQPGVMPDEVQIRETTKKVKWFYAFSFYDSGKWTQYCTPSFSVKSQQICPGN
ncbi:MAG: hypothetical protein EOP06_29525 [Proteobacteria bacterium]|nr:MAG: hypothetical protein EOP06_29525 [Pseudomonadota bacterium]